MEYIDISSNPQPQPAQQPAQMRAIVILRCQIVEEYKTEAFLIAKVDNPEARRIQMAEQLRSKKR